jgi:hypothetical protein
MVDTKIDKTSMANELSSKNRMVRFKNRTPLGSVLFGPVVSRVSPKVTKTAPATNAAGAPILAVHSHASNALLCIDLQHDGYRCVYTPGKKQRNQKGRKNIAAQGIVARIGQGKESTHHLPVEVLS